MTKRKTIDKIGGKKMKAKKEIRMKILSTLTTGYYEAQENRKSQQNRIRNIIYRLSEDIGMREKIDEKDKESYEKEYKDKELPEKIVDLEVKGKIDTKTKKLLDDLLEQFNEAKNKEERWKDLVIEQVGEEPIYDKWLKNINGIAGILSAHLLYYFGYCENAKHVSNCWSYAGLAPDSKHKEGESSNFNVKLRTAMWKLADTLLKTNFYKTEDGKRHPGRYRRIYEEAKSKYIDRLENDKVDVPGSRGHADNMARRILMKRFLSDYYRVTKTMTGQKQTKPYGVKFGNHNFDDVLPYIEEKWGVEFPEPIYLSD